MKIYDCLGVNKVYWSAPKNKEGLTDVRLTLYQHDGTVLLNNVLMSETGDGVYEHPYNFTSHDWYLAVGYSESKGGKTTESIRVGNPLYDYVYGVVPDDSTVFYEVNLLDDTNIDSGQMTNITATDIWWTDVTGLAKNKYFFKMNRKDTARFDYPFIKVLTLVLEPGYNLSSYPGSGKYIFDSTSNVWVYAECDVDNTRASDLNAYIEYHYPGVTVNYIKSYYEAPTERFKVFHPHITPLSNDNNFPLVELNQENDPEKNAFYIDIDSTSNIVVECR